MQDYEKFVNFFCEYFPLKKMGNAMNKNEFVLSVEIMHNKNIYFTFDKMGNLFIEKTAIDAE